MISALDGKIIGDFMHTEAGIATCKDYGWTNDTYKPDACIVGRKTVKGFFVTTPELNPDETEVVDGD